MILHGFFRSSASYRIRIALNLKQLTYDQVSYALRQGEQRAPDYLHKNPQGLVPTLEIDDGVTVTQSLAIMEYLDAIYPEIQLVPDDPLEGSRVRTIAMVIACEIHPVNNLQVLSYLENELNLDEDARTKWVQHWVSKEFEALERRLSNDDQTGVFCHGDSPTMADVCLVPQVFNAKRFGCDMSAYPIINRIVETCSDLEAFSAAAPELQPDAQLFLVE